VIKEVIEPRAFGTKAISGMTVKRGRYESHRPHCKQPRERRYINADNVYVGIHEPYRRLNRCRRR
jgi:hypothetical protein